MTWWLDVPSKNEKYGKLIWSFEGFEAYEYAGTIVLFKNDYSLGRTGSSVFARKYKGDFNNWIEFLKNKDLEKIEYTRSMLKETEASCKFIEDLWNGGVT